MSKRHFNETSRLRGMSGMSLMQASRVSESRQISGSKYVLPLALVGFTALGGAIWLGLQKSPDEIGNLVAFSDAADPEVTNSVEAVKAELPLAMLTDETSATLSQLEFAAAPVSEVQAMVEAQPAPEEQTIVAAAPITEPEPEAIPQKPDCVTTLKQLVANTVIPFSQGAASLAPPDITAIDEIGAAVSACPQAKIIVAGHSDASGDDLLNMQLSWERAETVLSALDVLEYDTALFEVIGYGARQPVEQGDADFNPRDRRVEFRVLRKEEDFQ